ncbi:hypothetical protein SmJEL517_g04389 [Synchytrium microbalum]|uniref:Uncharacterized protein n=1 Tax=Synchytrium microbalum TaxID=1806994 RepID=A0A507C508_9FUNG|nr:uncharacterized protein SmJEL517_g04389 [Synchytrium microbalum]TPX32515.1 hypothetical protein SmJEL517_g04389 [Synchytrium microbalum]
MLDNRGSLAAAVSSMGESTRFGPTYALWNAALSRLGKTGRSPPICTSTKIIENLCYAIKENVTFNNTITTLDLVGLPLTIKALVNLGKAISSNASIRKLSLANCRFGDDGFKAIAPGLKSSCSIRSINVSACNLTSFSASLLAELLKSQALRRQASRWATTLRFSSDDLPRAAENLESIADSSPIRRVNLCCNFIGDEGCEFLADALREEIGLRALDLQFNEITTHGGRAFQQVLDFNKELVLLDLRNNLIDPVLHHLMQRKIRENNEIYSGHAISEANSELLLLPAHDPLQNAFHVSCEVSHTQHTQSSLNRVNISAHTLHPTTPKKSKKVVITTNPTTPTSKPAWKPAGSNNRWIRPKQRAFNAVALLDPSLRSSRAPSVPDNTQAGSDWDADSQSHMEVAAAEEVIRDLIDVHASGKHRVRDVSVGVHQDMSVIKNQYQQHEQHETESIDLDTSVPASLIEPHEAKRGMVTAAPARTVDHGQDLSVVVGTIEKSFKGLTLLLDELERKQIKKRIKKAMKDNIIKDLPHLPVKEQERVYDQDTETSTSFIREKIDKIAQSMKIVNTLY